MIGLNFFTIPPDESARPRRRDPYTDYPRRRDLRRAPPRGVEHIAILCFHPRV